MKLSQSYLNKLSE